ncbi:hypothetical protein [Polyangium aurulentum]|uniref:hypothetical protein n=1 Tax=Polyangium aurulentum TaxID=2567896 RepID=UPI001F3DF0B9|nr:hypothetical protein [Polyangium aurulentum]
MNTLFSRTTKILLTMGAVALAGCGGEEPAGQGSVSFTTWGEEYIEKEIPAAVFEDGWSVRFSKFLVVIGDVTIADEAEAEGARRKETKLFDHVAPGPKKVEDFRDLEAKAWTKVSYEVRPAAADTALGDGATADDLAIMKMGGHSVYVEGEATKGAEKKTFKWGFSTAIEYADCEGERDGKPTRGVIVTNGGTDTVELTIHGDHFFYDDLQSPNAVVRFNAIASADADMNGEVTLAELSMKPLVDIDPADGAYGTGAVSEVNDLGAFVTALSQTLGHFRGEGECFAAAPK